MSGKHSRGDLKRSLEKEFNKCKHVQQVKVTALCPGCQEKRNLLIEAKRGLCPVCGEIDVEKISR